RRLAPAHGGAGRRETAAARVAHAHVFEYAAWRRLPSRAVAPTLHAAVVADAARLVVAGRQRRELACRRARLSQEVLTPTRDAAVVANAQSVQPPGAQALEAAGRRARLAAVDVATEAHGAAVGLQAARLVATADHARPDVARRLIRLVADVTPAVQLAVVV